MADSTAAPSLLGAAFGDLSHELATTRRVLERVPDEHLSWRPHARSYTLGQLAGHIPNVLVLLRMAAESDELDLASVPSAGADPGSREEILRAFDQNAAAVTAAMERLREPALGDTWRMRHGDRVLVQQPRLAVLRGMGINHLIHHRAQLSVYLRLLDVPLPPMYGPTADESF